MPGHEYGLFEMNIKGVLFDFDGTLTFPDALDFPAIKRELGCPVDKPILEYIETQPPEHQAKLTKILEKKEEIAAEKSFPNKGSEKCLSVLKDKGIALGILTRNSLISVEKAMQKFKCIKIDDFAAIITREFSPPKPHPDGVLEAARQMGLMPDELLMVGDFRFDVIAGKRAGAPSVLLNNNGTTIMKPGDPEPGYTISHLEELFDIIGGL